MHPPDLNVGTKQMLYLAPNSVYEIVSLFLLIGKYTSHTPT